MFGNVWHTAVLRKTIPFSKGKEVLENLLLISKALISREELLL